THRHAVTAVEKQRSHLDKLLKDPSKPAFIPPPPKEKTIRPAREMMKNVQGSSAGAGSGEFHVYKASRRREYERLKILEEQATKEIITAEFERKRKEAEDVTNAKTAKNRARRQKKKERAKAKGSAERGANGQSLDANKTQQDIPIKKRRLVNGRELVFRRPGDETESEEEVGPQESTVDMIIPSETEDASPPPPAAEAPRVVIHE
ncbi:hypothetical protein AMATHDRAFT_114974, partial [Amanita thiersii Skay4041]